jgi:hypothetical protein
MAEANISILDAAMENTMNVVTRNVIDNTAYFHFIISILM